MYIALSVEYGRDDQLIFAQQLGVDHVVADPGAWDGERLARLQNRVEKSTLRLAGLEGLPLAEEDSAVEALRAVGAAGIGLVAAGAGGSGPREAVGRGEALVGTVEHGQDPVGPAIVAAAAAAGVRLALGHRVEGAGIDLDLAAAGDAAAAAIEACGERLLMVRAGNGLDGRQAFLNEGQTDLAGALLALQRAGFTGPVRAVPPPGMVGDTAWGHKGRAYDLGYLKAVLQTIESF